MDLNTYFLARVEQVETTLDQLLPGKDLEPVALHGAMRYSIFAGGKRIRPVLFMAACEALGADWKPLMPYGAALEMIHTYSLIHDDLPCMDDDALRRGRPTCHKIYGEATALLAGDALLTQAFSVLSEIKAPAIRIVEVTALLGKAAGSAGMVGGQVLDLESEAKKVPQETMQKIHAKKTGAMFSASILGGAILCGADVPQYLSMEEYSRKIGIAFQIVDDILDIVGDETLLGKPIGSDQRNQKSTYPVLFGLDESRRLAEKTIEEAVDALKYFDSKADALREIASYILKRNH